MNDYQRACELKEETIANRRYIHEHAEVGLELPQTRAYVMEKLKEYGLEPKACGAGVTATLGKAGKVTEILEEIKREEKLTGKEESR